MPSHQRKRGRWIKFWPQEVTYDRRGNRILAVDLTKEPTRVRCVLQTDRTNRAEIPGQQDVDVVNCIVPANIPGMGMWARAQLEDNGRWLDVNAPPFYRHGTRHVRHWTIPLRYRPDEGDGPGEQVSLPDG